MIKVLDYFAALVRHDKSIPLFEAALAIAQDADPQLDISGPQLEIDRLASKLVRRLPADASMVQKIRILNHFFYDELGFSGNVNDYYNPDNSYLHHVLTTRRGIPISLAVIYMELAEQVGLDVRGISFPGHFLMKLSIQSGDIILDPFNGVSLSREELEDRLEPYLYYHAAGGTLSLSQWLQDAPARDILVRMLRNLKALYSEPPQWQRLLDIQQRLLILLPDDEIEQRDRGLAFAELECPQAALQDLQRYLAAHPNAADAPDILNRLPALRKASKKLN